MLFGVLLIAWSWFQGYPGAFVVTLPMVVLTGVGWAAGYKFRGYLHWGMWLLLAVAGATTVFSLFYYLRVLKAMFLNPEPAERRVLHTPGVAATFVALISLPILALGSFPYLPDRLASTANHVARVLFQ